MVSDPNKEYEAILPLLNRVHRRIKDAPVTHEHRAALMTMIADGEPGSPVPGHVVLLIAIAERIADIEFCEELVEYMANEDRHSVPGMGLPN